MKGDASRGASQLLSLPGSPGTEREPPKLLFLACYFPPLNTAACVRTWNTARYMARMGWGVTVVTPHPSVWRRVERLDSVTAELEQEGIRRILTGHRWRCLSPLQFNYQARGARRISDVLCRKAAWMLEVDRGAGWAPEAWKACTPLTRNDVDVILATGSPFATFRLAKRLSDRLGCPYVLDYRDPWTGNPHRDRASRAATLREEAKLLQGCAAVTIVSRSLAACMEESFHPGSKLHVVTNGYDPEELARVKPHDFGHFAIVYTGDFYPPKSVISPVMAALRQLKAAPKDRGREWRFHYYGNEEAHVREAAAEFGVTEQVVLHGHVARQEALAAVRGAGVAVVITSVAEQSSLADKGIVTSKLYEAVGLGTPILLVAPPESDAEATIQTTGLAARFAGSDPAGMASFLHQAIEGHAPPQNDPAVYSWTKIAQAMDTVLRTAMAKQPA